MSRPFGTRLISLIYLALPCRAGGCFVPFDKLRAGPAGLLRSRKKHISDQSYDDLIISILPERDDPYCGARKQTVAELYKSVECSLLLVVYKLQRTTT